MTASVSGFEIAPYAYGLLNRAKVQGAGEIISTAGWDDQHGKLKPRQRRQMTMDGPVTAEDQDRLGIGGREGQALQPFCGRSALKRLEIRRRST